MIPISIVVYGVLSVMYGTIAYFTEKPNDKSYRWFVSGMYLGAFIISLTNHLL